MARSINAILRKHVNAQLKPHLVAAAPADPRTMSDEDWLAWNYRNAAAPAGPAVPVSVASRSEAESYDSFMEFLTDYDTNEHPDPMGRHIEPLHIHSPAPSGRIKFERPKKRRAAERNERDCELPESGAKKRDFTATDDNGSVSATISINPYAKTFAIRGSGFVTGPSVADKRAAARAVK